MLSPRASTNGIPQPLFWRLGLAWRPACLAYLLAVVENAVSFQRMGHVQRPLLQAAYVGGYNRRAAYQTVTLRKMDYCRGCSCDACCCVCKGLCIYLNVYPPPNHPSPTLLTSAIFPLAFRISQTFHKAETVLFVVVMFFCTSVCFFVFVLTKSVLTCEFYTS